MPARKLYATTRLMLRGQLVEPGAPLPELGVVRSADGWHTDVQGRPYIVDDAGRAWRVVSGGGRTGTATAQLDPRYTPDLDIAAGLLERGLATTDASEAAALRRAAAEAVAEEAAPRRAAAETA